MNIILMRLELIDYHYNFLQATSVTEYINDTGKNYAEKNGNYSGSVVVIGIAVGCALAFGILIIVLVVFCKRRKL